MRRPATILAIGLAAALLSACAADLTTTGVPANSTSAPNVADPLAGTAWSLSKATLGSTDDIAALGITAEFANATMSGRAPVNTYSASYSVKGSKLQLGPIASTLMAGPPEQMQAEQDYFRTLATVTGYAIVDGQLWLLAKDQQVLGYAPNTSTPSSSVDPELEATMTFAQGLVGMTVAEAKKQAEAAGHDFRIVSMDGKPMSATTDYVPTRINATVVDGKVTEVSAG